VDFEAPLRPAPRRDSHRPGLAARAVPDLAPHPGRHRTEAGCSTAALKKFAHEQGIPVRLRGGTGYLNAVTASRHHPSQISEPLRQALHGPQAIQRLHRLLLIAQHPSIPRAAQANGIADNTLYIQVARIERDCGGRVINRWPKARTTGNLTSLGEQLRQQARDYLGLAAASLAT
jgi:hypothetical protein